MGCRHGGLAIIRVEEDAVGQTLDALRDPVELAIERLLDALGEAGSVTSRVEYCSMSARGDPSATIFALSITTSRSHSCSASSM